MDELRLCKQKIKELSLILQRRTNDGNVVENTPSNLNPRNETERRTRHRNPNSENQNFDTNNRVQNSYPESIPSDNDPDPDDFNSEEAPPRRDMRRPLKCEMDKWRIKFSGGNGVKFLKKVDKLQKCYGYEDETIFKYFHLLLDGHALEWYWQFSDQYEISNLAHLKQEFSRVYKPRESDMMLISSMYNRKQNQDTFERFYNDIVDLNFSLKEPLPDTQLIEILRTNMIDEIRQRIFTFETKDRIKFFHKANQAYSDVCNSKDKKKPLYDYKPVRKIHELDFDEMSNSEIEEINSKLTQWKSQRTERKCYNCHQPGHLLSNCPEEITRFFCFKCGLDGYATPKCPKCTPKASRSGD